jgi:hypothetical protein
MNRSAAAWVPVAVLLTACSTAWIGTHLDPAQVSFAEELQVDLAEMEQIEPGLYVQELSEGMGETAGRGDEVSIQYAVWLPDGSLVDTSLAGGAPFDFRIGGTGVIRGWNLAVPGMKVGGRRKLVVRPGLAYGSAGSDQVPHNATLVFEIQLLEVRESTAGSAPTSRHAGAPEETLRPPGRTHSRARSAAAGWARVH